MMTIFKLDYLKSFENDLKQQLNVDKKYLPISKKLVALLREINPFLETLHKSMSDLEKEFNQKNLLIHKSYAENLENFSKSLKVIMEKNQQEIEKSQKVCHQKIHDLNHQFKLLLEHMEQRVVDEKERAKEKVKDAEMSYNREISGFHKIILEAKKRYQETTQAIENEKTISLEQAAKVYDEKIAKINQDLVTYRESIETKIEEIRAETQYLTNANDEIYLNIKTNYSALSIQLNKKINELKKHYAHAITVVDKEHITKLKPIEKAIEHLKVNYQETQTQALNNFSEKLSSLNVLFDLQKDNYEKKKDRIIHEANEAITLLNSKLSAYREQTTKEKLITSRDMRDQMKSIEDPHERDKTNRQLTRKLNALDNELNKQIMRTNKDILEKHREQQRRLFMHDQAHLKEINDWRLQKALYEYDKKQEFAKIDLNFHHNMEVSEQQLKLLNQEYAYKKDVLLLTHNKDLLPLEYQLQIAQAIQERELNLLANDAHLLIAESKLNEKKAQYDLDQKIALAEFERKKAEILYQADSQVLNITIQLEMEKAKARRDFETTEQELRIELAHLIFNKTKDQIEFDLNHTIREIELEKDSQYIEHKFQLDTFKYEQMLEVEKRQLVISEAKYRNQQRLSNEKASRLLKMNKNELEFNQEQTSSFLSILRKHYMHDQRYKEIVIELYHLPSHPEVLKGVIKLLMLLREQVSQTLLSILEHYQMIDHSFYMKKIEDSTGYKYMLKHEDMMNFFESEIQKNQEKRQTIEKDIKALEESFFAQQTALERNHAFINQLSKIGHDLKNNSLHSEHKHHDIKENQKLISNHEHEIKRIKQQLVRIEKDIDKKHKDLTPLDLDLELIKQKQEKQEKMLSSLKHQESSVFYRYLNKNQAIYQALALSNQSHDGHMKSFMNVLLEEVYLSDNFIHQHVKKHHIFDEKYERMLEKYHQKYLDLMLDFYLKNENEQRRLISGFQHSSKSLILNLNKNYQKRLKVLSKAHKKQAHDRNRQLVILKEKFKKKSELEKITYEKKLAVDQLTLRELEYKIQTNTQKADQELKTLNENQVSIAIQYRQDYDTNMLHRQQDYQKQLQQLYNAYDQHVKLLETQHDQMEGKNQAIISRYQQAYEKHLVTLEQRRKNADDQVQKAMNSQGLRVKNLDLLIKRMNQKRESELRNIQFHSKRYMIHTRNEQTRMLNKDIRILKKSHRFKVKMLQLN